MIVAGIPVTVARKAVRGFRISVHPPEGEVRVSAPLSMGAEAIGAAVGERLDWIRKHRERFRAAHPAISRSFASGDTVYWLGRPYTLELSQGPGRNGIRETAEGRLEMRAKTGSSSADREAILYEWYRAKLKELLPPLLSKWETALGVSAAEWGLKRMRTRWGSCNPSARRVWLSLELAPKPLSCIEYVVAHELAHLIERSHGKRFKAILDRALPDWRARRALLNGRGSADSI